MKIQTNKQSVYIKIEAGCGGNIVKQKTDLGKCCDLGEFGEKKTKNDVQI